MCGRLFPSLKFCAEIIQKAQIQLDNLRKKFFDVCGKNILKLHWMNLLLI